MHAGQHRDATWARSTLAPSAKCCRLAGNARRVATAAKILEEEAYEDT